MTFIEGFHSVVRVLQTVVLAVSYRSGTLRLNNLPKVMQLESGKPRLEPRVVYV